jgi:cytochrome P450
MERAIAHRPALMLTPPPIPDSAAGLGALRALLQGHSLLAPLAALHADLGDVFQLPFPNFNPVVLVGPEAARFVLVDSRDDFRWRIETDPVARLLRHGLLMEDGDSHDRLRALMTPALHRRLIERQVATMWECADEVTSDWRDGQSIDVLNAMRRIALICLTRTLFGVDIAPDLRALWRPLLRTLAYIAPGPWLVWPGIPRPGYAHALRQMDDYLFHMIALRRASGPLGDDLLSLLVNSELSDDLIRDQLLTMLIAGHDTATASLAWALYALGKHPPVLAQARAEVDSVLNGEAPTASNIQQLHYLEHVIKETLRLYPPIHVSNRLAARELEFAGRRIPAGARVLFSIYLTHRHPRHWPAPERFDPERFHPEKTSPPAPFTYLPFGGGPRFCIGAVMAQVEVKVVLARLLQRFDVQLLSEAVRLRMGATLEPSHDLRMRVNWRKKAPQARAVAWAQPIAQG